MKKMRLLIPFFGLALTLGTAGAQAAEFVYATTGGQMREVLQKQMYEPFKAATGVSVVPFDTEIPDQWARVKGMLKTKNIEFDMVTATAPDLVDKADILLEIPCDKMENIKKYALPGACEKYGVARTTGGMVLTYDTNAFKGKEPKSFADFWDVKTFPGVRALPDTGDRDWWMPAIALLADGVQPERLFPLDLDRAYKKLDEIKPNIAIWYKTGSQVQQLMRDKEIAMTITYSGRALGAIKDGAPFAMSWSQALKDTGYFAILKDGPNAQEAVKFIDFFYGNAEGHPALMRAVNYATSSSAGLSKLPEDEQKLYATYPDNYKQLVTPNFEWIGKNRDMLRARWTAWLAQ